MFRKFLTVFVALATFPLVAQVVGEGRFYAGDDDSLTFVKNQLHYQAVRDVISKEMKSMGLDEKVFWENYESRFETSFAAAAKEVHDKYAVNGEIPANKKSDYNKELRAKRLTYLARFGRLQGLVSSYSVKRMTRSPQAPQSRYYQIEAKLDRRQVNDLYLKFTSNDIDRQYQTLYVTTQFRLKNMSWGDAGVEIASSFTDVVKSHWRKWLEAKFSGVVQEIVFTDDSLERQLRDFLLLPRDIEFNKSIEEGSSSHARFASGLWLKIGIDLEKIMDDTLLEKREIAVDGDQLLLELKTNQSISQADLPKETKLFYIDNINQYTSALASMVYSKPLPYFENSKRAMGDISIAQQDFRVNISSLNSIQELMEVGTFLNSKGVIHQVQSQIVGFDGKKGTLSLTFRGGREKLSEFLKSLTGQNVSSGKILQVNPERPTDIVLMLSPKGAAKKSDNLNG